MDTWKVYLEKHLGDYLLLGLKATALWLCTAMFVRKIHILSHVALIGVFILGIVGLTKMWKLTSKGSNQIFLRPSYLALLGVMFGWGMTTIDWNVLSVGLVAILLIPVNSVIGLMICWLAFELRPIEKRTQWVLLILVIYTFDVSAAFACIYSYHITFFDEHRCLDA